MSKILDIFDFDGTLFDSPGSPAGYPGKGWWDAPESLLPPCVPKRPSSGMFLGKAKSALKRSMSDPDRYPVVVTGRRELHRRRLVELLQAGGLQPEELFLNPGSVTAAYKVGVLRYLTKMMRPQIRKVEVWEDNTENLRALQREAGRLGIGFEGHHIKHTSTPATCAIPSRVASRYTKFRRGQRHR